MWYPTSLPTANTSLQHSKTVQSPDFQRKAEINYEVHLTHPLILLWFNCLTNKMAWDEIYIFFRRKWTMSGWKQCFGWYEQILSSLRIFATFIIGSSAKNYYNIVKAKTYVFKKNLLILIVKYLNMLNKKCLSLLNVSPCKPVHSKAEMSLDNCQLLQLLMCSRENHVQVQCKEKTEIFHT